MAGVTKVKVLVLVLELVFNFDLFKFSAAILEKSLFLIAKGESMDVYRLFRCNEFSHFFSFHKYISSDFRKVVITALMNDFSREIRCSPANY